MSNNFLDQELNHWGKIYTDISFSIDDISELLSEDELKSKKFYKRIHVLGDYIKKIEYAKSIPPKKSFFGSKNNSYPEVEKYKNENYETLNQLENCSKCACLNCTSTCEFSACRGCRFNSFIKSCDKNEINVTNHKNYTIDLTNNDTGRRATYKVLATMQSSKTDQWYIVLENIHDEDDKYILYYYPGIKEDTYGEITNPSEFDFIVETFQDSTF